MTGILERIEAKLDQLLAQGGGAAVLVNNIPTPAPVVVDPRAALEAQLAALNAPAPAPAPAPNVSGDQLQALIMPHIDNVAIKEALGAAMRAAGINALPEAQPHQYGDLYARFQSVLAAHGVGAGAPAAAVATSII